MRLLDPAALADRQIAIDRERTRRFPELFDRKLARMTASPLAFLRGAAPLFYEVLERHPELAAGPPGEGFIVGDMHLENFGAYRPEASAKRGKEHPAVFDLNDFDDAIVAPWRLDVLRLTTSVLLGGRELGANGAEALALCDALLVAWAKSAFDGARLPPAPPPVRALVAQVEERSRLALLDARTRVTRGRRRFVRGARYADLPKAIAKKVPKAFARYVERLGGERPKDAQLEILDAALRIAGTGSLGGLRVAVLVSGKGGSDGCWIFDMKEERSPSGARFERKRSRVRNPAERVAAAAVAMTAAPPRMIGTTKLGGLPMYVRRLSPQEDKLDLGRIAGRDLLALATFLGGLLGKGHARAVTKAPRGRWSASDLAEVRRNAITLAGLHEAVYLELCARVP